VRSVEHHVGRLVEIRLQSPITMEELDELRQLNGMMLASLGKPAVVCTDLRAMTLFSPELAERFLDGAKSLNPRIERSAFLLPERAVFTLQMERIIREAGLEARRTFVRAPELEAWLGELLDKDERARLGAFLGR
jgi:hypothetical protein